MKMIRALLNIPDHFLPEEDRLSALEQNPQHGFNCH